LLPECLVPRACLTKERCAIRCAAFERCMAQLRDLALPVGRHLSSRLALSVGKHHSTPGPPMLLVSCAFSVRVHASFDERVSECHGTQLHIAPRAMTLRRQRRLLCETCQLRHHGIPYSPAQEAP